MEDHSEVESQGTTSQEDNRPPEEQALFRTLEKGITEATEETHLFAKEITNLLTKLGLEPDSLSSDVKEMLDKVACILRAERLPNLDDVALQVARSRREVETKKAEREKRKLSLIYNDLSRKHAAFSKEVDTLEKAVSELKSDVKTAQENEEDESVSHAQLEKKLEEYRATIKKMEEDTAEMQVEELYPEKILQKFEKYIEISADLVELKRNNDQYEGLPPNLAQAKMVLEAKRKEYESLEKELQEKMAS